MILSDSRPVIQNLPGFVYAGSSHIRVEDYGIYFPETARKYNH